MKKRLGHITKGIKTLNFVLSCWVNKWIASVYFRGTGVPVNGESDKITI